MLALLLLQGVLLCDGKPCIATSFDPAPTLTLAPPCRDERELFHGFVVDTARIGGGLMVDLWSTEYALDRCASCHEGNVLGLSKNARIYLKGAMAAAVIAICHKLRRDGHPVWAKWIGRGALALQVGAATSNVVKASR